MTSQFRIARCLIIAALALASPGCLIEGVEESPELTDSLIDSESQALDWGTGDDEDDEDGPVVVQGQSIHGAADWYRYSEYDNGTSESLQGTWFGGQLYAQRDGAYLLGKDVKGVRVKTRFGMAPQLRTFDIEDVKMLDEFAPEERVLPLHSGTDPSRVFLYKVTRERLATKRTLSNLNGAVGSAEYNKEYLCRPPKGVAGFPEIYQYALAIPLFWDDQGTVHGSGSRFTFACLSGAAAKCDAWGYSRATGYTASIHAVQACTRMAIADYCGTRHSYTLDGTQIDFADDQGINATSHWDMRGQRPEALWGKKGIYCMSRHRIENQLGWVDGKPMQFIAEGQSAEYLAQFCGGVTRYNHEIAECPDDAMLSASLEPWQFGFDPDNDVVLANSSESEYWFLTPVERAGSIDEMVIAPPSSSDDDEDDRPSLPEMPPAAPPRADPAPPPTTTPPRIPTRPRIPTMPRIPSRGPLFPL